MLERERGVRIEITFGFGGGSRKSCSIVKFVCKSCSIVKFVCNIRFIVKFVCESCSIVKHQKVFEVMQMR